MKLIKPTVHKPVLYNFLDQYLKGKQIKTAIDCTLGGGGHALMIFEHLKEKGTLVCLDQDQDAITRFKQRLIQNRFKNKQGTKNIFYKNKRSIVLVKKNFQNLKKVLGSFKIGIGKVNFVLFDLGLSSDQIIDTNRGFSFNREGDLDMRMDKKLKTTAGDIINIIDRKTLTEIFEKFGELKNASKIAQAIIEERTRRKFKTTKDLANLVKKTVRHTEKFHPTQQVFQALRIAVNNELSAIQSALPQALEILAKDGICACITFHSLEDRIIKNIFKNSTKTKKYRLVFKKPIVPDLDEIHKNYKARSAKLRIVEKVKI